MEHPQRKLKLAIVFVWALAHGVWIGAGWHAGSELRLGLSEPATCGCQSERGLEGRQFTAQTPCAACQLSLLLPDVPAAQFVTEPAATSVYDSPPQSETVVLAVSPHRLPPQTGPPMPF